MTEPYVPFVWRDQTGLPDVYTYSLPQQLRVRVSKLARDSLAELWDARWIKDNIDEEIERHLGYPPKENEWIFADLIEKSQDSNHVLTAIELTFRVLMSKTEESIPKLNHLFDQHAVGFQFENGTLVRRSSQYAHAAVVRPTLQLLSQSKFAGANAEFLKAHQFYRSQDYRSCLVECGKAFESTIKAICDSRNWSYDAGATAAKLVNVILTEGLVPQYLQTHFSGIRNTLADGLPTIRNKQGAHGQGATPISVPASLATYQLHLTASAILFLAQADDEIP